MDMSVPHSKIFPNGNILENLANLKFGIVLVDKNLTQYSLANSHLPSTSPPGQF